MTQTWKPGTFGIFPALMARGLTAREQCLLAWLCFHSNNEGQCWPSLKKLCEETGIKSRSTILKVLDELEAKGLIRKNPAHNPDGGRTNNMYDVCLNDCKCSGIEQPPCPKTEQPPVQNLDMNKNQVTKPKFDLKPFLDAWKEAYGAYFAAERFARRFKSLCLEYGEDRVMRAFRGYIANVEGCFASPNSFLQKPFVYEPKDAGPVTQKW